MVSSVWKFFKKDQNNSAKCLNPVKLVCNIPLKRKDGNTKSLWDHLILVHGMTKEEILKYEIKKENIKDFLSIKKINDIETLESYISYLVAVDMIPINRIVKSKKIKKLLQNKFTNCEITSYFVRNSITKHSIEVRQLIKYDIRKRLQNTNGKLNISFDEWSGKSTKQYMTVNVHFSDVVYCLGNFNLLL